MNQQEILQEDVKILWGLMTKLWAAPEGGKEYGQRILVKHLDAMVARHGEAETIRCADRVQALLTQELERIRSTR